MKFVVDFGEERVVEHHGRTVTVHGKVLFQVMKVQHIEGEPRVRDYRAVPIGTLDDLPDEDLPVFRFDELEET